MKLLGAPTLMVAGVAAISLYAAYRLVKAKREDVTSEGGGGELALLGDPLKLTQNRYYRARLRVREAGAPPFLTTTDRAALETAMRVLGFSNVRIFMQESDLPGNWPVSTKKNAGAMTRWFEGQWRGPSTSLPRPADIEAIWIAKPPSGATFTVSGLLPFFESDVVTEEELSEQEAMG